MTSVLPKPLRTYIALVALAGLAWLGYLAPRAGWGLSTLGEAGLFLVLLVVAGSFPLPVASKVKADLSTAALFAAVLVLEPGVAALTAAVGIVTSTYLLRFWGERMRLPWYKYPFNAGATAIYVGLAGQVFHTLSPDGQVLTLAVMPAALVGYVVGTALVTGAASLQLGMHPVNFWWMGTRENGPAEVSLLAFGFLGALVYEESPWTLLALVIPIAIIYLAFSRLAQLNAQLAEAIKKVEALQGRIANSAKLASIGAISVDMAHQIKNPLAIVLGRLETLSEQLPQDSRARRHLDIALQEAWRIDELTQTFTSTAQARRVLLDLPTLVNEAFGIAGLRSRKGIQARCDFQADLAKVGGAPVLLREAFSNIFANAMDAMQEGGVISIAASRTNGKVVIRISDTGHGIPAEIKAHLFEPFHSTKPQGSGLGLFAAKHILEMHQGGLEIDSEEGQGTTVTVFLPVDPLQSAEEESTGTLHLAA